MGITLNSVTNCFMDCERHHLTPFGSAADLSALGARPFPAPFLPPPPRGAGLPRAAQPPTPPTGGTCCRRGLQGTRAAPPGWAGLGAKAPGGRTGRAAGGSLRVMPGGGGAELYGEGRRAFAVAGSVGLGRAGNAPALQGTDALPASPCFLPGCLSRPAFLRRPGWTPGRPFPVACAIPPAGERHTAAQRCLGGQLRAPRARVTRVHADGCAAVRACKRPRDPWARARPAAVPIRASRGGGRGAGAMM